MLLNVNKAAHDSSFSLALVRAVWAELAKVLHSPTQRRREEKARAQRLPVRGETEMCTSQFTSMSIIAWLHLAAREAGQGYVKNKRE